MDEGKKVLYSSVLDDSAPDATTLLVGEEGDAPVLDKPVTLDPDHDMTTLAVGEEGDSPPAQAPIDYLDPAFTTLAIGEEGDAPVLDKPVTLDPDNDMTTLAMGEEGGDLVDIGPFSPINEEPTHMTTLSIGEEGDAPPAEAPINNLFIQEDPGELTTNALGEEGGDPTPFTLGGEVKTTIAAVDVIAGDDHVHGLPGGVDHVTLSPSDNLHQDHLINLQLDGLMDNDKDYTPPDHT